MSRSFFQTAEASVIQYAVNSVNSVNSVSMAWRVVDALPFLLQKPKMSKRLRSPWGQRGIARLGSELLALMIYLGSSVISVLHTTRLFGNVNAPISPKDIGALLSHRSLLRPISCCLFIRFVCPEAMRDLFCLRVTLSSLTLLTTFAKEQEIRAEPFPFSDIFTLL